MLKAKKQSLTPEECLAEALVPEGEQPHDVPENWVWVRLPYTFTNMTSSQKKIKQKNYLKNGLFAVVDQGRDMIGGYSDDDSLLYEGDLPVIIFGDHTRIVKYVDFPFMQGADGVKVLKPKAFLDNHFFYYALQNVDIPDLGYRRHFPLFPQHAIPTPPAQEQLRIVTRIESLFEKLDRTKALVQSALDSFENRKAAILHRAFTGELTAKWRKKNGVELDSWLKRTLQSVCSMNITDGTHQTPTYCDEADGIPFISSKDVKTGVIDWTSIKYIPQDLHEKLHSRLAPQRDDVLLAKNGTTGMAAIVDTDLVFDIYVTLAVLRPNTNEILPRFLLQVVNSPLCKVQFDENLTGIGVPNLHLRDIKEVEIRLPTLPEQQEIARILDSLLENEKTARELSETVEKIDHMKKAILARAFRGELGTNDPSEESAIDLKKY